MFAKSPDLALFLTQPTVRTLRFLSCPPRSPVPSAQFPNCRLPTTRSCLRQDAFSVIAINPHMIDAQAGQLRTVSAREIRRELTDELQRFNAANADRPTVTAHPRVQRTAELP